MDEPDRLQNDLHPWRGSGFYATYSLLNSTGDEIGTATDDDEPCKYNNVVMCVIVQKCTTRQTCSQSNLIGRVGLCPPLMY